MSLSKNINPSLVLVQPRKTRPFIPERLLMGRNESNLTETDKSNWKLCDVVHHSYKDFIVNTLQFKCFSFAVLN